MDNVVNDQSKPSGSSTLKATIIASVVGILVGGAISYVVGHVQENQRATNDRKTQIADEYRQTVQQLTTAVEQADRQARTVIVDDEGFVSHGGTVSILLPGAADLGANATNISVMCEQLRLAAMREQCQQVVLSFLHIANIKTHADWAKADDDMTKVLGFEIALGDALRQ